MIVKKTEEPMTKKSKKTQNVQMLKGPSLLAYARKNATGMGLDGKKKEACRSCVDDSGKGRPYELF